jgi:DNA-binding PadR family transcriptional regulator
MYRDNSLIPSEAIRLAALGSLAKGPRRYGDVAREVRHFIGRLVGPSLDLLGSSLELLRFEGLVEPIDGAGMEDNATLALTQPGRAALHQLLTASLRAQVNDMNKLVMALKLRFLHLLDAEERIAQAEMLEDALRAEIARLSDLRGHPTGSEGLLGPWLDLEIAQAEARLHWCRRMIAQAAQAA